jgi:hypothetical protein
MRTDLSELLIPDECGHRALDETLADWREERARSESAVGRVGADMRALAGLARVFTMTAGAGLVRAEVWRCFAWTMIAGTAAAAAMAFVNTARLTFAASQMLLMVPGGIVVLSAFAAAFGLGLSRSRRVPGLTLCALMFVTTAGLAGYIVPKANEIFRQQVFEQFAGAETHWVRPSHLLTGIPEQSAAWLLRKAMSDEPGAARRALLQRLAWTLSPVALLLLGAALRTRFSEARAWRLVQVTGGALALAIFIGAAAVCVAIQDALTPPYAGGAQSLPWWTAIVVSLIVTLWLSRPPSPFRLRRGRPDHPRT